MLTKNLPIIPVFQLCRNHQEERIFYSKYERRDFKNSNNTSRLLFPRPILQGELAQVRRAEGERGQGVEGSLEQVSRIFPKPSLHAVSRI